MFSSFGEFQICSCDPDTDTDTDFKYLKLSLRQATEKLLEVAEKLPSRLLLRFSAFGIPKETPKRALLPTGCGVQAAEPQ